MVGRAPCQRCLITWGERGYMIDMKQVVVGQWLHLYRDKRWYRLRQMALSRDQYRCARCQVLCVTGARYKQDRRLANVNHRRAHKGDPMLFYDLDNLETVCQGCHSKLIQKQERSGYHSAIGEDGWPLDPDHPINRFETETVQRYGEGVRKVQNPPPK